MSEQKLPGSSTTPVFSIADIRNSIFAKIQAADTPAKCDRDVGETTADKTSEFTENTAVVTQNGHNGSHNNIASNNESQSQPSTQFSKTGNGEDDSCSHKEEPMVCTDSSRQDNVSGNQNNMSHIGDFSSQPTAQACTLDSTVIDDSGYPFQGDLMQTSTDFSQLASESSEEMAIKQEHLDNIDDIGGSAGGDVSVTRVEYRTADPDDGEKESDSSSLSDMEGFIEGRNRMSDEDDELFGKPMKKNCHGFDDMRTPGEVFPEELAPLEDLTIDIGDDTELQQLGMIDSFVGVLAVVRSTVEHSPLQDDTVMFTEDRRPLGQVFEVMGQVRMPFYSIRFNSEGEIVKKGVKVGTKVFFAPTVPEITHYVFVPQLQKMKGSDASWEDNNEPPATHLDYSDDEQERQAKAKLKNRKKGGDGDADSSLDDDDDGDDNDDNTDSKKTKQHKKKFSDAEMSGRGRGRRRRFGRGGSQCHSADQPSGRWPPSDWSSKRFGPPGGPPHFDWDHPGNTGPPFSFNPSGPPFDQNHQRSQPWQQRGPGNGVLQMPRFPPSQFGPPPPGSNLWGPPPPFMHGSGGLYSGYPPIPPSGPGAPPPGNSPVFNPNVPPPVFNSSAQGAASQNMFSPPSVMNSGFGSQPQFTAGPWGSGGQGSPAGVSRARGPKSNTNSFTSPGCSSSQDSRATDVTASSAKKQPVLDTRYIQNTSGD